MRWIVWAALVFLVIGGCREISYPPPPQRAETPHEVRAILDMTGGRPEEAWASIVSDVAPGYPNFDWRWTRAHPSFRFTLDSRAPLKLNVRISAVETVLAKVSSQHVTFNVNGKAVGAATLDAARLYDLTFPVDQAVFGAASPAIVRLDVEPCLVVPGEIYCILVHSVGFIQENR